MNDHITLHRIRAALDLLCASPPNPTGAVRILERLACDLKVVAGPLPEPLAEEQEVREAATRD